MRLHARVYGSPEVKEYSNVDEAVSIAALCVKYGTASPEEVVDESNNVLLTQAQLYAAVKEHLKGDV